MRTCLASFRHRPGFVTACFLCSLFAAPLLTIGAARAQEGFAGWSADGDGSFASSAQKPVDPPQSAPRWTFSAETIVLGRTGGANQPLVGLLPGGMQFAATQNASALAAEAFNSNQFWQGFSAGPKISVTYHDESGYGAEFSYFNIFTQSATKTVGPTNPADWLVMYAPGAFWQTQDFAYQGMAWKDATNLYNAEANGRLDLSPRVTLLGGLRWLQLNDELVGWLTPADRIAPTWKGPCLLPGASGCALSDVPNPPPGGSVVIYPPFWTTSTQNNLYGAQIGVDAKLLELGRFSIDGVIKAGVFDNDAKQSTLVSMAKTLFPTQAAANHAAFVSEAALQAKYQLAKGLALKVGYEALWLDGVALAPGQIRETYTTSPSPASPSTPVSARALGINCGSNVLFQGATVGLEFSF
ncbi:MAG: BBP7 family outer membrane beta-barrel protein [Roseiarcus sp.]|jgi:hypothetical protein